MKSEREQINNQITENKEILDRTNSISRRQLILRAEASASGTSLVVGSMLVATGFLTGNLEVFTLGCAGIFGASALATDAINRSSK